MFVTEAAKDWGLHSHIWLLAIRVNNKLTLATNDRFTLSTVTVFNNQGIQGYTLLHEQNK